MEKFLAYMKEDLSKIESVSFEELGINKENTALIVVDMVKGFYNEGPLANPDVKNVIEPMLKLNEKMKDYKKVFFIDSHNENSVEFESYPRHCVEGTIEEELIDEFLQSEAMINKNTIFIKKNSINGFNANGFEKIRDNKNIENFIVVGVCTDICVKNFTLSLKTYFNEKNLEKRIIVPANMVETYDANFHSRDFWNLTSLFEMKSNGVQIVKDIN